jgi:tRNA (guanine37-N1)-methyltransferase
VPLRFDIITLFPEMFAPVLSASLLGKAQERGLLEFAIHDLRPFGDGRHQTTDDTPYGGGAGMVMKVGPVVRCLESLPARSAASRALLLSPQGRALGPALARELAGLERLILVCGRYEGVDDRVRAFIDDEVSVGDYVLSGGEIPALVLIDAVSRFVPGVLGNAGSPEADSFEDGLLEHPQFTRPAEFRGLAVPPVLLSGDHEKVRRWRRKESLLRTRERRPDLFAKHVRSEEDEELLGTSDDE